MRWSPCQSQQRMLAVDPRTTLIRACCGRDGLRQHHLILREARWFTRLSKAGPGGDVPVTGVQVKLVLQHNKFFVESPDPRILEEMLRDPVIAAARVMDRSGSPAAFEARPMLAGALLPVLARALVTLLARALDPVRELRQSATDGTE